MGPRRACRGILGRGTMATPRTCAALGCTATVAPEHPMCPPHWALVPPDVQALVRRHGRRGWADAPWTSYEWRAAARGAPASQAAGTYSTRRRPAPLGAGAW